MLALGRAGVGVSATGAASQTGPVPLSRIPRRRGAAVVFWA
ncbi:hypothetical protein ACTZWW_04235 [Salinarimonas sp. NSM]